MDIPSGISAVVEALRIAKSLKDFDNTLDNAEYKLAIAELTEKLADTKMALSDALLAINDKDNEIRQLIEQVDAYKKGEHCPICIEGRLKVTSIRPHPKFEFGGVKEATKVCQNKNCNHTQKDMIDIPQS